MNCSLLGNIIVTCTELCFCFLFNLWSAGRCILQLYRLHIPWETLLYLVALCLKCNVNSFHMMHSSLLEPTYLQHLGFCCSQPVMTIYLNWILPVGWPLHNAYTIRLLKKETVHTTPVQVVIGTISGELQQLPRKHQINWPTFSAQISF